MSTADQRAVQSGILAGFVFTAAFCGIGWWLAEHSGAFASHRLLETLALAVLPPAMSLAAGIGWAARTRLFDSKIDGSVPKPGSSLDLTLRYVTNTLEQLLLFLCAVMAFAAAWPATARTLLPVVGLWFALARLLFWLGYRSRPVARATGFAGTFIPSIALLCGGAAGLLG